MGGVMTLADRHEVPATQFELLTAGALKLFRDRGLEVPLHHPYITAG